MTMKFLRGLLDLIFPVRCTFCNKLLQPKEKEICGQCRLTLPFTDETTACQAGQYFSQSVSLLVYDDVVRDSIHRFKFKGRSQYATAYGRLMAQCVKQYLKGSYDLITWVPISKVRERFRGYDQAMLLAMAVALELDDVAVETLRKTVDTAAQSSLKGAEERRANVIGVYTATDPELVQGKRILLIDDIITTGSTISECASTLRAVGATDVVCATLARSIKSAKKLSVSD